MDKKFKNTAGFLLVLFPVLVYYIIVFRIAVNIPHWDEYYVALTWLHHYINSSFHERFHLLFYQANEHRIFSYFLTIIAEYHLLGEINFRFITIFGNLGLLGLLYFLYRLKKFDRKNLLEFSPVILLLFVPQQEITDWGIVVICSINLYLLVFASLACLNSKGYKYFAAAVLLAAIATFSFGNGMFTFPAGFLILLLKKQGSPLKITIWAAIMITCVLLYFIGFNPSTCPYPKSMIFHKPLLGIGFFLTFFSSLFTSLCNGHMIFLPVFGTLILAGSGYFLVSKWPYFRQNPLVLSYLLFILLSAFAVTVSRIGYGISVAAARRYTLLPALFVAVMYISTLNIYQELPRTIFIIVMTASLMLYCYRLDINYKQIRQHQQDLSAGLLSYYNHSDSTTLSCPDQKEASAILKIAIRKGYYNPPSPLQLKP